MRAFSIPASVMLALVLAFFVGAGFAQTAEESAAAGARKITNRVVPVYPALARSINLSGKVRLEALVLPNGNVKSVQVKGGNPLLVQSAESAVRSWKWEKSDHESNELVEFRFDPK